MVITYDEAKAQLDTAVSIIEEWNANRHLNNQIVIAEAPKEISVDKGIKQMADVLGFELYYEKFSMGGGRYYFMYGDYIVYQYGEEDDEAVRTKRIRKLAKK